VPQTKDCPARVKAAGEADGLEPGQFTALVSVFGNEDSVGDVVMPGAFTKTLADWQAKGDPIPVIWSHDWSDPFSHIGYVTQAEETADGLQVTGQLDLENAKAEQVYRLLKGRRVTQFSFAYDVEDGAPAQKDGRDVFELRQLKLHEVGPTLVGANQETELLAAKAAGLMAGLKEGRVLAAKHVDRLKEAHAALGEVIAAAEPEKSSIPERPGQPGAMAADGEQPSAKSADTQPAEGASTSQNDDALRARVAELVQAELAKSAATTSSTEETTPGSRVAPEGAARAGSASLRLRTDLDLLAAEAFELTE
jgi:HK97 family phage prohead protease